MMIERKNILIRLNSIIFFKGKKNLYNIPSNLKIIKIIVKLYFLCIFLNINKIKKTNINSRDYIRFITCSFGARKINSNHRIRKYFQVIDNFIPYAHITFCISEYTEIDPLVIQHQNIIINIERFWNRSYEDLLNKYPYSSPFFYNGVRYNFYSQYLKKHSEIKYVIISDDDTLFFSDPFPLIDSNPNVVHFMEDFFPFSVTKHFNYIWLKSWFCLDKNIKEKCGFKQLNKSLLSDEIKNKIPLNVGLLMGNSKNIIKIADLIFARFICPGMFPKNAEQGLLNYLDISGELKELGIPIKRHNIYNDSLLSCPNYLPIKDFIRQLNSSNFIAIHHYQYLKDYYN